MSSWSRRAAICLLAASAFARAATAAQPEGCPRFFPDFYKCGREGRYEGFVTTMISPYLFEDPFITTGIHAHAIWHDFPGDSVFQGGQAFVAAVQARVAVTDRLAFIATKDGFAWIRPDNPLLSNQKGFFDLSFGFKYALIDRPDDAFIVSPSFRIDVPTGSSDVFQGNGDGVAIPAVSAAWGIDRFHAIGSFGSRLPFDMGDESTSIFYQLHLDYGVHEHIVPFVELSGHHWTRSGNGDLKVRLADGTKITLDQAQQALGTGGFEGADIANLGSHRVAGNNLVTLAVGARFPLTEHISIGGSYEFPLTSREDIFHQRATTSLLFEF